MGIFGKLRKEQKEETISGRKTSLEKKETKKRKKKTQEKKPWGKKERYLVLVVLLITIVFSGLLALSARSWKLPGLPRVKIPDFSLFESEKIIIEKDGAISEKELEKADKTIRAFKNETDKLSGVYGLYVIDLQTGFEYGIDENETFEAASFIKLPVIAAMYLESEEGNLNLNTKYALKSSDKISGSGSLNSEPAGTTLTYRELVEYMGQQSDNTAFGITRSILGDEKIEKAAVKFGMYKTSLEKNETTPKDVGMFFKKLWEADVLSKQSSDEILKYLTDTIYEAWISEGVPSDIRVAHKFGREVHVVNDAGIVYAEKPFVLVIMGKGVVEREADKAFPQLAKIIYEAQKD
jgi:beta-lactamase class A